MFLTPKDIHDKTFKRSFKGYDENEVDEFLDLIIKEFNLMIDENERYRQELMAKPVMQDYNSASANEIKRLEGMLAQAIETINKNNEIVLARSTVPDIRSKEDTKALEKLSKLDEFKKALDSYKANFETFIDDQRKQLNEKYREIMGDFGMDGIGVNAQEAMDLSRGAPGMNRPESNFDMPGMNRQESVPGLSGMSRQEPVAVSGMNRQEPSPMGMSKPFQETAEKPQFYMNPASQPGLNEKPVFTTEQRQPEQPGRAVFSQPSWQEETQQPPLWRQDTQAQQPVQPQWRQEERPPIQAQPQPWRAEEKVSSQIPQTPPKYQSVGKAPEPYEQNPVADNRFKPNYAEYAWLYQDKDGGKTNAEAANMDITFRNPREKEELKRLIDEVID